MERTFSNLLPKHLTCATLSNEAVCRGDMGGCLYTVQEVREGVCRGGKGGCL